METTVMWYAQAGLIVLLGLSSACGPSHSAPTSAPAPLSDEIPVQIDNQNFSDMDIFIVQSGQRMYVGQAGGMAKTTLTIRNATRGDGRLRLSAEPVGAVARITTPLLVIPQGQSIFWTIGSDP